jgi:RNA polymerase sigma-70 factor, ECF subfamily
VGLVPSATPSPLSRPRPGRAADAGVDVGRPSFDAVYEAHFDVAWRTLRRLGVPSALVDDAVQEVFLVVHRRFGEFEGRSSWKTWIYAIVTHVAGDYRRAARRKSPHLVSPGAAIDADTVPDERSADPHDCAEQRERAQALHRVLDQLDDESRTVLVLAELEEMSVPEIAEVLGRNVNTVYGRLRIARRAFDQAARRERARDTWRLR